MRVKLKIHGELSFELGTEKTIEIEGEEATVRDVLKKGLNDDVESILNDYNILVNGKAVELDEKVKDGDEIRILPLITGGFFHS